MPYPVRGLHLPFAQGFRQPSKVFCIAEVWLFFMTCMHLVWSFIHDWDRYCMCLLIFTSILVFRHAWNVFDWWFLCWFRSAASLACGLSVIIRLTELDFQWREKEKDIGENASEIPDENGCGMGMIWYLGKFHHDRSLFSRSLGIIVYFREIIPFYGPNSGWWIIKVDMILKYVKVHWISLIYIYIYSLYTLW